MLSSGKFIISRDVIFDETKSQNADEIDNLLSHLEKKLTKGKSIHTEKPDWIERDFSPNMDDQEVDNSSSDDDMSRDISNTSPHAEQSRPKWVTQLLQDVHPDEQNKVGTRSSSTSQSNYALISNDSTEPTTFTEAIQYKEWKQAMVDEYDSVIANGTWKLVDCPSNIKPIGCKCVYRIKYNAKW